MKIAALFAALLVTACADPAPGDDGADAALPWWPGSGSWRVASQACHTTSGQTCHRNFAGGPGPDQAANIQLADLNRGAYDVAWSYGDAVVLHAGSIVDGCLSMTDGLGAGLSAYGICAAGADLAVASTWSAGTADECRCDTVLRR